MARILLARGFSFLSSGAEFLLRPSRVPGTRGPWARPVPAEPQDGGKCQVFTGPGGAVPLQKCHSHRYFCLSSPQTLEASCRPVNMRIWHMCVG